MFTRGYPMIIPWFHLISPTNGWNIKLEPDGTSEEDPIQIRWTSHQITISVGYIYCVYIYILTHYVILFWIIHCVILFRYQYQPQWKPLLNLHFPRCSYGFSHCFADFFPIRSAIPGRLSSQEARRRCARAQLFVGPGGGLVEYWMVQWDFINN